MTIINQAGFASFLRKPDPSVLAVLIYGPDEGKVRELGKSLVLTSVGGANDPFGVVTLEDDDLSSDPGKLFDEVQSLSLLGGSRVVWVRGAASGFLAAIEPLVCGNVSGNLIVAEAGELPKGHKLRGLFEGAKNLLSIACYPDETSTLPEIVLKSLKEEGLTIDNEALDLFVSYLGSDRLGSRSEIEKLKTYVLGRKIVSVDDVLVICGDTSLLSVDTAIDAIFDGLMDDADDAYERLVSAGTPLSAILSSLSRHVGRLQRFRIEFDAGRPADGIVRASKPPIFFGRTKSMVRQLQTWSLADLERAAQAIQAARLQSRLMPSVEPVLCSRLVLSLCRLAIQLRRS